LSYRRIGDIYYSTKNCICKYKLFDSFLFQRDIIHLFFR